MPSRLAHITNHFFDLPSQDVPASVGSPRPVLDFPAANALYSGNSAVRHGSRSPAAAVAAALRRTTNAATSPATSAGAAAGGRPSSPTSSFTLTPPQSPALSVASPNARWSSAFPGSPNVTAAGTRVPPASAAHPQGRRDGRAEAPSSPLFLPAPSHHAEASSTTAPLVTMWNSETRSWGAASAVNATSLTSLPHSTSRAGGGMRGGARRLASSSPGGLPSPVRPGPGAGASHGGRGAASTAASVGPSPTPASDPMALQYTAADAEMLLHPLMHYVEDEKALRLRASQLRRRRTDEVSMAVNALERPTADQAVLPLLSMQFVHLQCDRVLHARGSRLLCGVGDTVATTTMDAADATAAAPARPFAVDGRRGGSGRDRRRQPHSSQQWCSRGGAGVAGSHAASPADSLTSPSGASASLYLRELAGRASGDGANTAAAHSEAGEPTDEGSATLRGSGGGRNNSKSSSAGPLPETVRSRRRRSGSRLRESTTASGSDPHDAAAAAAVPAQSRNAEKRKGSGASHSPAPAHQAESAAHVAAMDEEELALALAHNVFANYRTLPLSFAQQSYEMLPAKYRAGLDAIAAEVLAQQNQQQQQPQQGQRGAGAAVTNTDVSSSTAAAAAGESGVGGSHGGASAVAGSPALLAGSRGPRAGDSTALGLPAYSIGPGIEEVPYIGVGYLSTASAAAAASPSLSSVSGGARGMTAVVPGWGSPRGLGFTAASLPPSRAMEERRLGNSGAGDDDASTSAAASGGGAATTAPGSPLTPALAAAAAAAPPPLAVSAASTPLFLHQVHHTIQSLVARGDRDVALHYLIAMAPYRFPGLSSSDRVLALFNQIRFFLPSPRFSTVLMAVEAWRSLYRSSVGASPADCAHMTQELLSMVETYLCHGRTYAEYVSGLLVLRAVLSMTQQGSGGAGAGGVLLLQHRALVHERLPTLLLAVWVTLMERYTVDDLPQPPRRVLRDLAANAMQDLFTVALEAEMVVPVQNVVANAVNVFFSGPQPTAVSAVGAATKPAAPPAASPEASLADATDASVSPSALAVAELASAEAAAGHRHGQPPRSATAAASSRRGFLAHLHQQPQQQRRTGESPPLADSLNSGSDFHGLAVSTTDRDGAHHMPTFLNAVDVADGRSRSGGGGGSEAATSLSERPDRRVGGGGGTTTTTATSGVGRGRYTAGARPSQRSPSPAASALQSRPAAITSSSTSPLPTAPTDDGPNPAAGPSAAAASAVTEETRTSYRALTKSVWRSVKRAARRLVSTSAPRASAAAETTENTASTVPVDARTEGIQNDGAGQRLPTHAAPQSSRERAGRRLSPARPSPPLLIEVPDDVLLEAGADDAALELLGTSSSAPAWAGIGSLRAGGANHFSGYHANGNSLSDVAGPQHGYAPRITYTPDLVGSSLLPTASAAVQTPHSPVLPTAPSASATFHALWQPTVPSSLRLSPAQRHSRVSAVFHATASMNASVGYGPAGAGAAAAAPWADSFWGVLAADGDSSGGRDALWSLPLALGLRAAGRPLTLDATIAAASMTVGAFLCAWRIAGSAAPTKAAEEEGLDEDDEAEEEEGGDGEESDDSEAEVQGVSSHPYCALVPPPPPPPPQPPLTAAATQSTATAETSAALSTDTPAAASTTMPSGYRPFNAASSTLTYGGASITSSPGGRGAPELVLPLLSQEQLNQALAATPLPGVDGAGGEGGAASLRRPLASLPSAEGVRRVLLAEETAALEQTVNASLLSATLAAMGAGHGGVARAASVSGGFLERKAGAAETDPEWQSLAEATRNMYLPPVVDHGLSTLIQVEDTAASAGRSGAHRSRQATPNPSLPLNASAATPSPALSSQGRQARADGDATPETAAQRRGRSTGRSRSSGKAPGTPTAAAPKGRASLPSPDATPAAPPLRFYLPSWTVSKMVDRCLHPTWERTPSTHTSARHSLDDRGSWLPADSGEQRLELGESGAARDGTTTAAAVVVLSASAEGETMLNGLIPLLSQYYGAALSEGQVSAATQRLVNCAVKRVKMISQAMQRSATAAHASPGQPSRQPEAVAAAAAEAAGLLPPSTAALDSDSAMLDGTEVLTAVLFACTVAERFPALYEGIVSQRLYPLLLHSMRLMAFDEEPRFWLPTPFASTAAWTAAPAFTAATAAGGAAGSAAVAALTSHVVSQWVMLTAARSMFQRVAMPALLMLTQNMPTAACAQHCAPLVDRLVQVGLRQPFSTASVATATSICTVYPTFSRMCQASIARAMSVVLSTPDDAGESVTAQAGGDGNTTTTSTTTAGDNSSSRRPPPLRGEGGEVEEERAGRGGGRGSLAGTSAGARIDAWPTSLGSSHFLLPSAVPQLLRQRRPSAAALRAAARRRASRTRLLKHHIFRAICLFPSSWEGTTLFFLEFCLPYLRHPDAQLRLECVQACTKWPLSDCWNSVERTVLQLAAPPRAAPAGGAAADGDAPAAVVPRTGAAGGVFMNHTLVGSNSISNNNNTSGVSASLLSGSVLSLANTAGGGRRGTVMAAVTRPPVRDPRSEEATHGSPAESAAHTCFVSSACAEPSVAAAAAAVFPAGSFSAARAVGGVKRGQTLSAVAAIARSEAGLPARDSRGLLVPPSHASPSRGSEGFGGGSGTTGWAAAGQATAALPFSDGTHAIRAVADKATTTAAVHTVEHHGRTHVNALREIVHHLVEIAVCDPEPLIRRCALESLTPETYQLLYPHEAVLQQLFIALWDSYLPNRVQAAQLLCALAPLNPPFIYPRLREVMVRYVADLTVDWQGAEHGVNRGEGGREQRHTTQQRGGAAALRCGGVQEDSLYVLSHVASRLKQSTPLYLPQLLSIIYAVLRSPDSSRGAVLQAMHLLIFLRDDSTQEQSALFDPFVDLIAEQLADGEGDMPRVLAAVAALQTLLQSAEPSSFSPPSLPLMVESLHSLLYRKPSVGTEFSMAVLQLLGTISNIEPWQPELPPQPPALLRRPQNRYALPPLSSLAGVLGKNSAIRALWPVRAELADNAHQALEQLQKVDRFMPYTAMVWPDKVLRALLRTASGYMNGTMNLTQEGLGECLLAIMNILTNTIAVRHLDLYLPGVLTLVIDLLERKDARPLQSRSTPSPFFMKPAGGPLRDGGRSATTSPRPETALRGRPQGAFTENLWLLFLRSLFDLVMVAGRRIAPLYPLLNVFLRRSWQRTTLRGMVQCCEVLDALCWAVPDLLRVDTDVWIIMLLTALMQYDTVVLTHRRAHEAPAAAVATPTTATTATMKNSKTTATASAAVKGDTQGTTAASTANGTGASGLPLYGASRPPAPSAAPTANSGADRSTTTQSVTNAGPHDAASSSAGHRARESPTTEGVGLPVFSAPVTPNDGAEPQMPTGNARGGGGGGFVPGQPEDAVGSPSWEEQLKLVYHALTMCLTSLQPIASPLMRPFACLCLSECLKSSYVPRGRGRRGAATTAAAAAAGAAGAGAGATAHARRFSESGAPSPSFGHETEGRAFVTSTPQAAAVLPTFDLMADPHEELVSFINTCVCEPLMDYLVHSKLESVSIKVMKNILARLDSLSTVHDEALRRANRYFSNSSRGASTASQPTAGSQAGDGAWPPSAQESTTGDGSAAAAAAASVLGVRHLPEVSRVVCEAHLREARELLCVQRRRQADATAAAAAVGLGAGGGGGGAHTPTLAEPWTVGGGGSMSGSAPPTSAAMGVRAAQEALWFSGSALRHMWVQSADRETTVRRYFPFDAVYTSWETESEMHLLGCLLAAAAWRHPSSTVPFLPVLYSYVGQRFGPESIAMSYMRCVCSSYYDLCVPVMPVTEEEAMAAEWLMRSQHLQRQQQQQQVDDGSAPGQSASGRPLSPALAAHNTAMRDGVDAAAEGRAGGVTWREGSADVILRNPPPYPADAAAAAPIDRGVASSSSISVQRTLTHPPTAATLATSSTGSRTGSWEAEAPLRTVMTAEGDLSSITSRPRVQVPPSSSRVLLSRAMEGGSGSAVDILTSFSPLSASDTSVPAPPAILPAAGTASGAAGEEGGGGGAQVVAVAPAASHGLLSADWVAAGYGGGSGPSAARSSANTTAALAVAAAAQRLADSDTTTPIRALEGESEKGRRSTAFVRHHSSYPPSSARLAIPSSHGLSPHQQQQYPPPLHGSVVGGSHASALLYAAGSLTQPNTTATTEVGADFAHSPFSRSGPSTRDQSPAAGTLPIPVGPGSSSSGGGTTARRSGLATAGPVASTPVLVSHSGSSSGPIPIASSFYPGSFFNSSVGDVSGSGHRYPTHSSSAHSGDGRGLGTASAAAVAVVAVGSGAGQSGLAAPRASSHGHPLPPPAVLANASHLQLPRPPSTTELATSSPLLTVASTAALGVHQPAAALLTVGSIGAAASLSRRRSLLARPSSLFTSAPVAPPPAVTGGGVPGLPMTASLVSTPAGPSTAGGSPLWQQHHPPLFVPVGASSEDLAGDAHRSSAVSASMPTALATMTAAGAVGRLESPTQPQSTRRRLSPLMQHHHFQPHPPPPLYHRSIAAAVASGMSSDDLAAAGALLRGPQPSPVGLRSSNPSTPILGGTVAAAPSALAARQQHAGGDSAAVARPPSTDTVTAEGLAPSAVTTAGGGQRTPLPPLPLSNPTTTTAAAAEAEAVFAHDGGFFSPSADAAAAAAPRDGVATHHRNSLIFYFEAHRLLRGSGWRRWWEQLCLLMVECSQDYCVKACAAFARQHCVSFACTELLPLALLSTLPSCTVAELAAWLQALRTFYTYHTDPCSPVPQQVASGVARLAHEIRLHRHAFFPPEIVTNVVDRWLPDGVVADLAHHSLNPPLRILYLEQDLARSFSWNRTALLMAAMDELTTTLERKLFVHDSRFQRWLRSVAAAAQGSRGGGEASTTHTKVTRTASSVAGSAAPSASSSTAAAAATLAGQGGAAPLVGGPPSSLSSSIDGLPPATLELLGFYRAAALEYVRIYSELTAKRSSAATTAASAPAPTSCVSAHSQRRARHPAGSSSNSGTVAGASTATAEQSCVLAPPAATTTAAFTPEKAIAAAMRCYTCLYDFDAVLRLWEAVKSGREAAGAAEGQAVPPTRERSTEGIGNDDDDAAAAAVAPSSSSASSSSCAAAPAVKAMGRPWDVEAARYVAVSAQALSRWSYVAEAAQLARDGRLSGHTAALSPLLERLFPVPAPASLSASTSGPAAGAGAAGLEGSGRLRSARSWPTLAADRWPGSTTGGPLPTGQEEEEEEGSAGTRDMTAGSTEAFVSAAHTETASPVEVAGGSLVQLQEAVFLGAAQVVAHDYESARVALGCVRDGLRDSYAVFHTDNMRIKLEWSCIFQQLSDLEEGMHTLQQAAALQEDGLSAAAAAAGVGGASASATTAAAAAAGTSSASDAAAAASFAWSSPGSPVLEREVHGRVYPEATVRRLRNIVCRPLSANTSPLQRFLVIAARSAIAPISWQLDNIVTLGETLDRSGQPMRAVLTLHRYAQQPSACSSSSSSSSSMATVVFKQQLQLETVRRLIRNLPHEAGLRELYAYVQTALRQELWASRRTAARWGSATPSPALSTTGGPGASAATTDPLYAVISDAQRRGGALLDAQELGPSLTSHQVDLLLLSVACRRRLAHVLLRSAPAAQRALTGGVPHHRSDPALAPAASSVSPLPAALSVTEVVTPAAAAAGVGGEAPAGEAQEPASHELGVSFTMYPHSPVSPSMARQLTGLAPSSGAGGSASTGAAAGAAAVTAMTDREDNGDVPSAAPTQRGGERRRGRTASGDSHAAARPAVATNTSAAAATAYQGGDDATAARDGGTTAMTTENLTDETALFVEYYLLEHAVTVTHYVPAVWREFSLVLFDICLAIHAEWKTTGDAETRQNFLAQSAKTIHGLQLASQLWESGAASALGKGLGPFPAMSQRRHRNARAALPSAHLLLKAFNLAVTCEVLVQSSSTPQQREQQQQRHPLDTTATAAAAAAATAGASSSSGGSGAPTAITSVTATPHNPPSRPRTPSPIAVADSADAHERGEVGSVSPSTASLASSHRTNAPHNDSFGGQSVRLSANGSVYSKTGSSHGEASPAQQRDDAAAGPHESSQENPSSSSAAAAAEATPSSAVGGFACLDFSAASYKQWAAIAPFLINAATRHPYMYAAVRDMCVHSRHLLRQLIFMLVANLEHSFETLFVQRDNQVSRGRGVAGTRTLRAVARTGGDAAAAAASFTGNLWASSSSAAAGGTTTSGDEAHDNSTTMRSTPSTSTAARRGVEGHVGMGVVTSVPELWEDESGDVGVVRPPSNPRRSGRNNRTTSNSRSRSSSSSSSSDGETDREGRGGKDGRLTVAADEAWPAQRRRRGASVPPGGADTTALSEAEEERDDDDDDPSSPTATAGTAETSDDDLFSTGDALERMDGEAPTQAATLHGTRSRGRSQPQPYAGRSSHRRAAAASAGQHHGHAQHGARQSARASGLLGPLRASPPLEGVGARQERVLLQSTLLAEVAAASAGHHQHVHEAMQLRGFVRRSWDSDAAHATASEQRRAAEAAERQDAPTPASTGAEAGAGVGESRRGLRLPAEEHVSVGPEEAEGTLEAMELVLGGHCPLPVPMWLLPSVFGGTAFTAEGDEKGEQRGRGSGGSAQGGAAAHRSGHQSSRAPTANASSGGKDGDGDGSGAASTAPAAGRSAGGGGGGADGSVMAGGAASAVLFSPSTVPGVVHVRRYLVPRPAPHHRKEELIFLMLSDGAMCRFRHVAPAPPRRHAATATAMAAAGDQQSGGRTGSGGGGNETSSPTAHGDATTPAESAVAAPPAVSAADAAAAVMDGEAVTFLPPLSLMEQTVSMLLSHLPMTHLQRPFVISLGVQDYMTLLPEQTSGSVFGATVAAAVLHAEGRAAWGDGAAVLTGASSAALNMTESLLTPSSSSSSARGTPSLHHLMEDYVVHLRVREMAQAAHTAVEAFPTSDLEATYIAAETGRGPGAQSDNSFPFNWAYGYPASAPPSEAALLTTTQAPQYRDLVRQRRLSELRYDQRVAMAYNKGDVVELVRHVRELLAARPLPSSTGSGAASTAVGAAGLPVRRTADETYAEQQRLYAYLATLPRPEAHLQRLLDALAEATQPPAPAPPAAVVNTASSPPLGVSSEALRACRLALLRVESDRCRAALATAFSADSSDATHWLEVRCNYARELAEWSVLQYLLDTHGRNCGDVLVNPYDGHVAMHTIGHHSLQAPPLATARPWSTAAGAAATAGPANDLLLSAPFPTRDGTLFRLTPVLQSGLPMQSPYALFQFSAAAVLSDIYMYVRDLTGIATYGMDRMTAFAYTTAPVMGGAAGTEAVAAVLSTGTTTAATEAATASAHAAHAPARRATLPPPADGEKRGSAVVVSVPPSPTLTATTAARLPARRGSATAPPIHPAPPLLLTTPPLPPKPAAEHDVPAVVLSASAAALRPAATPCPPTSPQLPTRRPLSRASSLSSVVSVTGVTELPTLPATLNPAATARLFAAADGHQQPSSSAGASSRVAEVVDPPGNRTSQRGGAPRVGSRADSRRGSLPHPLSQMQEGEEREAPERNVWTPSTFALPAPEPLPPPPCCFDARSLRLKLSYDLLLVLHADVEQEGREMMLRLIRAQRIATEASWPRQPHPTTGQQEQEKDEAVEEDRKWEAEVDMGSTAMAGGAAAEEGESSKEAASVPHGPAAAGAGGERGGAAVSSSQSAYDFVARLVAAATDEVNLLGVDEVTPHLWRRWAPHW